MSSKVLVTGSSGFLASHIVQLLNEENYKVIGTVRSPEKAEYFTKRFPTFEYEIVKDIAVPNAFDNIFKKHTDITYVIHTASPFFFNGNDPEKDLLIPARQGTLSILQSAKQYGKNVKKMVITSSFSAMGQYPFDFDNDPQLYTEKVWCNLTYEQGKENNVLGYWASKKFAELAAWDFMKNESPNFPITTVQFPYIIGPLLNQKSVKELNPSNRTVYELMNPKEIKTGTLGYIHVDDAAKTHVISMTSEGLDNKRCWSIAGVTSGQEIYDIIRKIRPQYNTGKAIGTPGVYDRTKGIKYDNSESLKYLKIEYQTIEKVIEDCVESFEKLEKS